MKTNIQFLSHSFLLGMKSVSDKSCRKKKQILDFSQQSYSLWGNVERYFLAEQATDGNMAHVHCTRGYRHTIRICNNYCLSIATMVARTHLNVTFICALLFFLSPSSSNHDGRPWQKLSYISSLVRQSGHTPKFQFHGPPLGSKRHKYTDLREHPSSTTNFERENTALLCCYSTWSLEKNQVWT